MVSSVKIIWFGVKIQFKIWTVGFIGIAERSAAKRLASVQRRQEVVEGVVVKPAVPALEIAC